MQTLSVIHETKSATIQSQVFLRNINLKSNIYANNKAFKYFESRIIKNPIKLHLLNLTSFGN